MKSAVVSQRSPSRLSLVDTQRPVTWKLEEMVLSYLENGSLPPLLSPSLPLSFATMIKSKVSADSPRRIRWINKLDDDDAPKFLLRIFLPKQKLGKSVEAGKTGGVRKIAGDDRADASKKAVGLGIDSRASSKSKALKSGSMNHEISKSDSKNPATEKGMPKASSTVKRESKSPLPLGSDNLRADTKIAATKPLPAIKRETNEPFPTKSEIKQTSPMKSEPKQSPFIKSEIKQPTFTKGEIKQPVLTKNETKQLSITKGEITQPSFINGDTKHLSAMTDQSKHSIAMKSGLELPITKDRSTKNTKALAKNERSNESPIAQDSLNSSSTKTEQAKPPRCFASLKSLWLNRSKATKTAADPYRKDNELLYCAMQVDALLMRILSSVYDEQYRRETAASPSERSWMSLEQDMGRLVVEIERQAVLGAPHCVFMSTVLLLIFQAKAAVLYRVNSLLKQAADAQLSTVLSETTHTGIPELHEMMVDNYDRATEYCAASNQSYLLEALPSTFPQTWQNRVKDISDSHAQVLAFPTTLDLKLLQFYFPFGPYTSILEVTAALYSVLSEYEGTAKNPFRYLPLNDQE